MQRETVDREDEQCIDGCPQKMKHKLLSMSMVVLSPVFVIVAIHGFVQSFSVYFDVAKLFQIQSKNSTHHLIKHARRE